MNEQPLYCVRDDSYGQHIWAWWSLAPTEEDSWRFFAQGCIDANPIERARRDGMRCLPVRLNLITQEITGENT